MLAMMHNRRLGHLLDIGTGTGRMAEIFAPTARHVTALDRSPDMLRIARAKLADQPVPIDLVQADFLNLPVEDAAIRSEEHTSELQSLMRISYAVFCLKKKKKQNQQTKTNTQTKQY